jgi:hypothetical protein
MGPRDPLIGVWMLTLLRRASELVVVVVVVVVPGWHFRLAIFAISFLPKRFGAVLWVDLFSLSLYIGRRDEGVHRLAEKQIHKVTGFEYL